MIIKQKIFKNPFMKGIISLLVLIISRSSRFLSFNWKNHTNKILIISIHKLGDTVLYIETEFVEDIKKVKGDFFLIPDGNSYETLLRALGVII